MLVYSWVDVGDIGPTLKQDGANVSYFLGKLDRTTSVDFVGSLRDREVACSASDRRARISKSVSEGQCHLIHLTILRWFS